MYRCHRYGCFSMPAETGGERHRAVLQFLLVEDDASVAETLKNSIEHVCEARVTSADNGASATHALGTLRFDLAVIDIILPDISGFELAARTAESNVPVLLISGHPEEQELCRLVGYPHLEKPFTFDALAKSARSILRDTRANIARVQQSYAKLTMTYEAARLLAEESHRLADDSPRIRAKSIAILEARRDR
jgi:DNA-binding response OmpR family regulator